MTYMFRYFIPVTNTFESIAVCRNSKAASVSMRLAQSSISEDSTLLDVWFANSVL